tara:strand:+ start:167 stop:346 length:180 start_codon:yes stop_codon:yes gene_type:complete
LDDQDRISDIEQAIALLKSALQKASGKEPLILKQLQLSSETAERCLADLLESEKKRTEE